MAEYSEKFEKMRIAGKLAAKTLDMLTDNIKKVFRLIILINLDMSLSEITEVILRHNFIEVLANPCVHHSTMLFVMEYPLRKEFYKMVMQ